MAKQAYVQLAHVIKPNNYVGGHMMSEKLDGIRAFWDGGISIGKSTKDIPWANREKGDEISTGLWSRYGKVIHRPDWWKLPAGVMLDGELYTKRNDRQSLMSIVKQKNPDSRWVNVHLVVFDIPPVDVMLADRTVEVVQGSKKYSYTVGGAELARQQLIWSPRALAPFISRLAGFKQRFNYDYLLTQIALPLSGEKARGIITDNLFTVSSTGGEGLMVKDSYSRYTTERSHSLLKVKKLDDSEGTITGFVTGLGKYEGLIGSVTLNWNGKIFQLSGFTDEERRFSTLEAAAWAKKYAGKDSEYQGKYFKFGDRITFKYRGLTRDGLPCEARYWRKS